MGVSALLYASENFFEFGVHTCICVRENVKCVCACVCVGVPIGIECERERVLFYREQ